jgi:hypothetical protein
MKKRIVMIKSFDKRIVDPDFCPHLNTVTVNAGSQYTIAGEATDDIQSFTQCLDCDQILQDDGTWADHAPEFRTQIEIPY